MREHVVLEPPGTCKSKCSLRSVCENYSLQSVCGSGVWCDEGGEVCSWRGRVPSINNDRCVKSINNDRYVKSIYNDRCVKSINNDRCVKSINNDRYVKSIGSDPYDQSIINDPFVNSIYNNHNSQSIYNDDFLLSKPTINPFSPLRNNHTRSANKVESILDPPSLAESLSSDDSFSDEASAHRVLFMSDDSDSFP